MKRVNRGKLPTLKRKPRRGEVTGLKLSAELVEDMFDLLSYTPKFWVWIIAPKTKKPARGSGSILEEVLEKFLRFRIYRLPTNRSVTATLQIIHIDGLILARKRTKISPKSAIKK
jgi:hypothetical protein